MDRTTQFFDSQGNLLEETIDDVSWEMVRQERNDLLKQSDLWMLADRYNTLTSEQQTELTTYRQALRDITDYATANEAADNFPQAPDWL